MKLQSKYLDFDGIGIEIGKRIETGELEGEVIRKFDETKNERINQETHVVE